MNDTCATCQCFAAAAHRAVGQCRRYPRYVTRQPGDWCFEHKAGEGVHSNLSPRGKLVRARRGRVGSTVAVKQPQRLTEAE